MGCCSLPAAAQENQKNTDGRPDLKVYTIRAADTRAVADMVAKIVPPDQIMLIKPTSELVVFAPPNLQQTVRQRIDEHERHAILFQRVTLLGVKPKAIQQAIQRVKMVLEREGLEDKWDDALRMEYDRVNDSLLVWGRNTQIELVQGVVQQLAGPREDVHAGSTDRVASDSEKSSRRANDSATEDSQSAVEESSKSADLLAQNPRSANKDSLDPRIKMLRAPRGPVKIVLVEGLDLLLIRGGGSVRREDSDAKVQVESIDELDLLLLKGPSGGER